MIFDNCAEIKERNGLYDLQIVSTDKDSGEKNTYYLMGVKRLPTIEGLRLMTLALATGDLQPYEVIEMANWQDIIPEDLRDPKKKEQFLAWLLLAPIPKKNKKYILVSWYEFYNIPITREDVEKSGAEP